MQPQARPVLIFATNNQHKIEEIQSAIGSQINVITLAKAGIDIDIPEPFDTLEANSAEKARVIHKLTGQSAFSEDSGLEVYALRNEPGVLSARYAGDEKNHDRNIEKLLTNMKDKLDRRARFRTVITLIWDGAEHQFEGICEGRIIEEKRGSLGFGYDPVFVPDNSLKTFAEMNMEEKNRFSHRRKAADRLVLFLQQRLAFTS